MPRCSEWCQGFESVLPNGQMRNLDATNGSAELSRAPLSSSKVHSWSAPLKPDKK
jgi:hypothetical protein